METATTHENSQPESASPVSLHGSEELKREEEARKKKNRKKRKNDEDQTAAGNKKTKRRSKEKRDDNKKPRKPVRRPNPADHVAAVNEQMRKALEEDQYSALGSVVDTDTDEEDQHRSNRGGLRLDRSILLAAMRKRLWMERIGKSTVASSNSEEDCDDEEDHSRKKKKKKKKKKLRRETQDGFGQERNDESGDGLSMDESGDDMEREEGSIFGQTSGGSNAIWVECDKCKKWRRLRGVIDEKKLPPKWYCSMNKNDPEHNSCSAPEENYETPNTPESAADVRIRKHLRVWVRRLESNETFEGRQPTMTRGKKRSVITNTKEPYEWVRCCNPSCGKWRALLRFMDAKQHVIDRAVNGEWYCVMNNWDEKISSCAAPQENLPAIGCPPWALTED